MDFDAFEDDLRRWSEKLPREDDYVLIVLKGHLMMEEVLTEIVASQLQQPDRLGEYSGRALINLAHACEPAELDREEFWGALAALNSLRNDLVHDLEPDDLRNRVKGVVGQIWDGSRPDEPESNDLYEELRYALSYHYGRLRNTLDVFREFDGF